MQPIRKRLVTDEWNRPVAVQVDYADWLEIERLLELAQGQRPPGAGLSGHAGTIRLPEDPLEFQARIRGEWT